MSSAGQSVCFQLSRWVDRSVLSVLLRILCYTDLCVWFWSEFTKMTPDDIKNTTLPFDLNNCICEEVSDFMLQLAIE